MFLPVQSLPLLLSQLVAVSSMDLHKTLQFQVSLNLLDKNTNTSLVMTSKLGKPNSKLLLLIFLLMLVSNQHQLLVIIILVTMMERICLQMLNSNPKRNLNLTVLTVSSKTTKSYSQLKNLEKSTMMQSSNIFLLLETPKKLSTNTFQKFSSVDNMYLLHIMFVKTHFLLLL